MTTLSASLPASSSSPTRPGLAWVSVRHLQHMVARGEAAGLPMDALLDEAGITRAQLADADGLVPMLSVELLLSVLSRRYADPLPGLHLASDIQPATFGVLGYILQSCTTLADVLDVLVRYNGLLSNIGRTSLAFGPGTVSVVWECLAGGDAFRRQATDYVLGVFVVLSRLLLPAGVTLVRAVNLAHARPVDAGRIREYSTFFQAPVYFSAPQSSLLIAADALRIRLPHGDAVIKELMERHALDLLRQRERGTSLVDVVQRLLRVMLLDGVPGKEALARQIGISERSLHRRLQEAGTSYRAILDAVRQEVATDRLCNSRDPVTAIAGDLGFSTHQAFLRWFRQVMGMTPGEYRKAQREGEKQQTAGGE